MKKSALFFAIFIFIAIQKINYSQSLEKISFIAESRYDNIDYGNAQNRLQASLRIPFQIETVNEFKAMGLVSTGSSFQSRWETLSNYKFSGEERIFQLNLRQLYLQRSWASTRLQLGAIPTVKGAVSSTGLGSNGWIDGGRFQFGFLSGLLEVVGGSLSEIRTPNFFDRTFVLNYFETETSQYLTENIKIEFSYEKLNEDDLIRSEYRMAVLVDSAKSFEFAIEGLYNLERESSSFGATVSSDLLQWIHKDLSDNVFIKMYYNYTSEFIGLRGILKDDFYDFGRSLTIELDGPLKFTDSMEWFFEGVISEIPRVLVGIKLSLTIASAP